MSRRRFLTGLGLAGATGALAAGELMGGSSPAAPPRRPRPASRPQRPSTSAATTAVPEVELPTAGWVMAENSLAGTTEWIVSGSPVPHAIEGYADRVSAASGDAVTLYVNARAPTFRVEAYRMGWYQGLGGRLVWRSADVPARVQPPPRFTSGINMVECQWEPSITFDVDDSWPAGNYLLKLVGSDGQQQYVPLTVRNPSSRAAVAVMNSVTTWQAYNLWHGYSLYFGVAGSGQSYANRSRVVSFDRPYALAHENWANGASDWMGNEFPFLMLVERYGVDLAYWTDLDLSTDASALANHKLLVSLGHDEYWSKSMFDGALAARDAGVNLAFLGANACFRHIRLEDSPTGPNRHVVCYKSAAEDPLNGVDDSDVTADWPSGPQPRPECILIGNMYQSNPVDAALVVAAPSAWGLEGTGMGAGDSLAHTVGSEFDAYDPSLAGPRNVEIWTHSPLVCRGKPGHSDMTYYSAPDAGGVFATGTNWWVSKLADNLGAVPTALVGRALPQVTTAVTAITLNVLKVLGSGPGGRLRPSTANWQQFYPSGTAPGGGQAGQAA
ncbi:MAG TPA: N,N-dimethylformamidase beta subunit family domain-containing protein [Acidimicrobiales bacterium]|nr:N,N-dimethylformamidase beta subunit family domain-containing protein [Acidimicrobiales bacterium]